MASKGPGCAPVPLLPGESTQLAQAVHKRLLRIGEAFALGVGCQVGGTAGLVVEAGYAEDRLQFVQGGTGGQQLRVWMTLW